MTSTAKTVGFLTGIVLVLLCVSYLGLIIAMMTTGSGFPPVDPYQTIFNILIFVIAICMLIFWVAIHKSVPANKQFYSLCSFSMIIIFATLVSINRYVALTVVRQSALSGTTDGLQWFMPYSWPSVMLAIELLAWGFFFGVACLSLTAVFGESKLEKTIRWALIITGLLSLCSTVGPMIGESPLKFQLFTMVGMVGFGPALTTTVLLIVFWFRKHEVKE